MQLKNVLNKVFILTEGIDDFFFKTFKTEMLEVLFLYCLGLSPKDIINIIPFFDISQINNYLNCMKNNLGDEWQEIELLNKANTGFRRFIKDYLLLQEGDKNDSVDKVIREKYFDFLYKE